ncbi:unnamed protein product [Medioppia subpectinata]|uniref:INPP5B PH domain-containing protein n=1 Tax=Medioppia subpectinata TaxID=1979941 RepID=A0A7R9LI40_9ACAR|nr:unnamed protein product [Medioppia subpectinata]CAG2118652.1 unnamed protein product [Medioppia subpectinata]
MPIEIKVTVNTGAICISSGLVQDWVITNRILALIENHNSYGLLVFVTSTPTVKTASDLTIESALPVNSDFKCEIGKQYLQ